MKPLTLSTLYFRLRSLFCILLLLNLHCLVGGCTNSVESPPLPSSTIRIPLTPAHPLVQALAGTGLTDATEAVIDVQTRTFRVIFENESHVLEGRYAISDGSQTITELSYGRFGRSVRITFDLSKRVAAIATTRLRR